MASVGGPGLRRVVLGLGLLVQRGPMKPTSRTRKPRAVKEEATRLHSRIIRARHPRCQHCGDRTTDCAHIVGRVFSHTRTDLDNAYGLCAACHRLFTNWPDVWMQFVDATIGRREYDRLKRKAQDGVGQKFDWFEELDRLRRVAHDEGVV